MAPTGYGCRGRLLGWRWSAGLGDDHARPGGLPPLAPAAPQRAPDLPGLDLEHLLERDAPREIEQQSLQPAQDDGAPRAG